MIQNNNYYQNGNSQINQQLVNNFANQFSQMFPNTTPMRVVNDLVNAGKVPQDRLNQAINFANQNSWVFK